MANKTLEVTLPQMGESVTEGVVGSWHKRVGDQVEAGETLVEIQTDKVDAEVPSPDSGRLAKILAQEGETVAVGASLAEIEVLPSGNGQGPQGDGQVAPAPAASTETPASPGPIAAAVAPAREDAAAPPTVQEPVAVPLPQMGESVSEGVVGSWHKRVGDQVEAGETLVEIQTDKVDAEVPSPVAGKVLEILVQEGETVSAGTILARIEPGSLTAATAPAAEGASSASSSMPVAPQVTPAGSGGQVADATPLARRRAERQGIPLVGLQGSGPDGLVRGRDVDSGSAAVQAGSGQRREEPIKGSRLALVQAMEESLKIPTATSVRTFEVGILEARRRQLNQALHRRPQPLKVSYTHLIAFALVRAAREQPVFSTSFRRTKDAPQKVTVDGVNLGLAVDQEKADGSHFLLVPVIRGAEALDFTAFHKRYEEMVAKVRQGGLQVDELEGATLTLTNPGGVGTVASVPRLMPGQATIVAVGAIGLPPGFRHLDRSQAEGLGLEPVITMTSTYDHRLVQGVESGLLLARLEQLLGGADGFYEAVAQSLRVELGQLPPRPAPGPAPGSSPAPNQDLMYAVAAGMSLVKAHRTHGHLLAHLDPLGSEPPGDPALEPETVKLTPELMAQVPSWMMRVMVKGESLAEALPEMRQTYCGAIAYEIEHISNHEQRVWLRQQIESGFHRVAWSKEARLALLRRLAEVDAFERFLRKTYLGQHTFSLEGLDVLVPVLELVIALLAQRGTKEVVLGMAHRGRLNVTAKVVGRALSEIVAEFESGAYLGGASTGDVKYHYGAEGSYRTPDGGQVGVVLTHNPSHLEAVDAVVEGRTRALQTKDSPEGIQDTDLAVPVLIHGDAAFTGQGVVTETLNLQGLPGYRVGGTIHIIANNQIGFTTEAQEGRSTRYASDIAKGYDMPIVHVNADDVEASLDAARLAVSFREEFHRDVLIDLIGYRRFGHNEGDEPAYTQPLMYQRIRSHPPVVKLYGQALAEQGLLSPEQVEEEQRRAYQEMVLAHQAATRDSQALLEAAQPTGTMTESTRLPKAETQVPRERLERLNSQLVQIPEPFQLNPKLKRQMGQRLKAFDEGGRVDWAHAEALALASLLQDGVPIRLTGQDAVRGTFSQRHLMFSDTGSGEHYAPIQHLESAKAQIQLYNSPLSEMGALGFEYGYGVTDHRSLVLWEAQYGDFFNNAQVVVDQFIAAGQAKWDQESRLTLLLPHGYEGSGPEHSSARIERFLSLAAEGNLRIAQPSTAAQYFHLLRLQALAQELRPLILFTPKSGLRLAQVASPVEELTRGQFQPVLDDPGAEHQQVRRLLLASGKIAWELAARREQLELSQVAVARVELLYPFPETEVKELLQAYPQLEQVVWVQEEPSNMGAFGFIAPRLRPLLPPRVQSGYAGRRQHAAPSEGSTRVHRTEQERLLQQAFAGLGRRRGPG